MENENGAIEITDEDLAQYFPGGLRQPDPPPRAHWLDKWPGTEIAEIIEECGFTRQFAAAVQRRRRARDKQRRANLREGNEILWRGTVTDEIPTAITWRAVTRGTRSRNSKPDIAIADLGVAVTWQGVDLPVGTRLLVDLGCHDGVIGSRGECIRTPHGVRVHIWPRRAN